MMDNSSAVDDLNSPLLAVTDEDDEDEFYDATSSSEIITTPALTLSSQQQQQQPLTTAATAAAGSSMDTITTATTSYYGKVSPLSTGMLFPSPRGIVDALPSDSTKPILLYSDYDALSSVAHICLLEKEVHAHNVALSSSSGSSSSVGVDDFHLISLNFTPKLFSCVHVCEALSNHDDGGMRIIKKINKQMKNMSSDYDDHDDGLRVPLLLHEGNIYQEGRGGQSDDDNAWKSSLTLLLPEYIDECIGTKYLLRPNDATGFYNMKLFIQRHSNLPYLFHKILTNPSPTKRNASSTQLLNLLKVINTDLQHFTDGPYLCGKQYTLADIYIYPIIERIVIVLSTYRNFWIPPSLTHLINWYDVMSDRQAIQLATRSRSTQSQNIYCYEKVDRKQYLIEVYECYARNEVQLFKEINNEKGKAGVNIYRKEYVVEDENLLLRDRSICEKKSLCEGQSCVIS